MWMAAFWHSSDMIPIKVVMHLAFIIRRGVHIFMRHTAYIFDFDGTLVDSMPYWSEKMLNILKKNNIEYSSDIIKRIATLGDLGTAKYFQEILGVKLSVNEMIEQMEAYALPKYRDVITLKAGVLDYLHLLKENNCSIHVLTASPHKMLDVCLRRNGIFKLFDNVWSCDDFGTTKTDVNIYVQAVKRIGVNIGEAVFFDDNINAVKTAAKAGLFTVGVYDKSGEEYTEKLKEISDLYINSFVGLQKLP